MELVFATKNSSPREDLGESSNKPPCEHELGKGALTHQHGFETFKEGFCVRCGERVKTASSVICRFE